MTKGVTEGQKRLIGFIEQAFHEYYGDDLTKFSGFTCQHANDWIEEHMDEYKGIRYELNKNRVRGRLN